MEATQLSTQTCAHHDVIELKYQACRDGINSLETLHKAYLAELKEIRTEQNNLKNEFSSLSSKMTLIVLLAAPVWAAIASVAVKALAGLGVTGG